MKGSVSLLGAVLAGIFALVGIGTVAVSHLVSVKVQTQTAADAAALAAASATFTHRQPSTAAATLAGANGALLTGCRCVYDPSPAPRVVAVEVTRIESLPVLGEVLIVAQARAEFIPPDP